MVNRQFENEVIRASFHPKAREVRRFQSGVACPAKSFGDPLSIPPRDSIRQTDDNGLACNRTDFLLIITKVCKCRHIITQEERHHQHPHGRLHISHARSISSSVGLRSFGRSLLKHSSVGISSISSPPKTRLKTRGSMLPPPVGE